MHNNKTAIIHAALRRLTVLRKSTWLLLPLLFAFSAPAWSAGKAQKEKKTSRCIAGICLESPVTQKAIVAKYGPGYEYVPIITYEGSGTDGKTVNKPDPDVTHRCYYDPKQRLYIQFNFDNHQKRMAGYNSGLVEIMASSTPMCAKKYTPKHPFPAFKTEHGVRLGMTAAKVRAIMGRKGKSIDMVALEKGNLAQRTHKQLMQDFDSSAYGENALYFDTGLDDELLNDSFFLHDGKVKSIHVSNSE